MCNRPTPPSSIIITGASSGIGESLALHYARSGVTLFLNGRDRARLHEVARACTARGARVVTDTVDVCDAPGMAAWIAAADRQAPVDLVIANAGISGGTGGGGEGHAQVAQIFAVNVGGVFNTIHPAIACMQTRGAGQVAIMSSLASFSGWPGAPAYGASKGAVRLYGEALRGALGPSGVRVSVICPGFVKSRMTAVNDYPMPFLMGADRAAGIIARGLARDQARISFPWQTALIAAVVACLPAPLRNAILKNAPRKPSIPKA